MFLNTEVNVVYNLYLKEKTNLDSRRHLDI